MSKTKAPKRLLRTKNPAPEACMMVPLPAPPARLWSLNFFTGAPQSDALVGFGLIADAQPRGYCELLYRAVTHVPWRCHETPSQATPSALGRAGSGRSTP